MHKHIVVASPHWRHDALEERLRASGDNTVTRVRSSQALAALSGSGQHPDYIFFPHWSWKIPHEIFNRFECVIFHMTDLPFGRGGSPLQNLICRGIYETRLSAIRCVEEMDAGPVYMKKPLSLHGSAEEILLRAAQLTEEMIVEILATNPAPAPQQGEATIFRRRKPEDGNLEGLENIAQIFDFIRMLDADGYPPAYIETPFFRFEFSRASLKADGVVADVKITRRTEVLDHGK